MEFKTSEELNRWMEEHQKKCKSAAFDGAQFKFEFVPTVIVEAQTVICMCCKAKKTVYVD